MTVCIAALSHWIPDTNAVVLASDRMVTMGGFIQYEHDVSKVKFVSPHIVAMMAGDTLGATALYTRLIEKFGSSATNVTVENVATEARSIYEELRRNEIDDEVFRPRGLTMEQFYQGGLQSRLQPHLVAGMDEEVMSRDYGVEVIIAGSDKTGGHIFTVSNPGTINNYQDIGYVAVGSGGIHATQSLIGYKHSGFHSLVETIYTVYASKRRAEAAPGVGTGTDLIIIPPPESMGWLWLDQTRLEKLSALYSKLSQPASEEITQMVSDLKLFEVDENATQGQADQETGTPAESAQETVHPKTPVPKKR